MKVTGGCHSGHITYEAEVDPATVRVCHCTDCQKLTGTVFRAGIASLPGTFVLKSGTPKIYIKPAEKREQTRPRLLPGMRHADLFRCVRAEPIYLWAARRRHRPARPICPACAPDLVPLSPALVDGSDARGAGRGAVKRRVGCLACAIISPYLG
jgi:glutathione-dependent formaldehyde-activating enzyme